MNDSDVPAQATGLSPALRAQEKSEMRTAYIIIGIFILFVLTQMVSCEMYWLEVGKNGAR